MSRVSQARSLGKYFLLVDNMLVVLGFFVVFPLISIRFVDQMGWAALMVGIALGLRQLVQQGLGIFGGAIADRFGAKPMIVTGMLMRAAGFAAVPWRSGTTSDASFDGLWRDHLHRTGAPGGAHAVVTADGPGRQLTVSPAAIHAVTSR